MPNDPNIFNLRSFMSRNKFEWFFAISPIRYGNHCQWAQTKTNRTKNPNDRDNRNVFNETTLNFNESVFRLIVKIICSFLNSIENVCDPISVAQKWYDCNESHNDANASH